jgi:hypothetical protein
VAGPLPSGEGGYSDNSLPSQLLKLRREVDRVHEVADDLKHKANRPDNHDVRNVPLTRLDPAIDENDQVTDAAAKRQHKKSNAQTSLATLENLDDYQDVADQSRNARQRRQDRSESFHAWFSPGKKARDATSV